MERHATESPIWISHHWPDHYDRCVQLGSTHVCRRCLVLYPLIVVSAVVAIVADVPESAVLATWLLPLPLLGDWAAEHLGLARYSAPRQVATTALAAPGFGIALALHVRSPFDLAATLPVLAYVVVLFLFAVAAKQRSAAEDVDWETAHDDAERRRDAELARLLARADEALAGNGDGSPSSAEPHR